MDGFILLFQINYIWWKGKAAERRWRKATGLQPKGHDSRVTDGYFGWSLWVWGCSKAFFP